VAVIEQIAAGKSRGAPQDKSQATKAPKLTKEHGLIDWARHAQGVCNQIRAMQPWPTAYSFLHGPKEPPARLLVFRARVVPDPTLVLKGPRAGLVRLVPGESRFCVETGAGDQVEIQELQPAGKRRMSAQEFLRGNAIPLDAHFR
jgi:methionyl-tRNA formyltransferase